MSEPETHMLGWMLVALWVVGFLVFLGLVASA